MRGDRIRKKVFINTLHFIAVRILCFCYSNGYIAVRYF